MAQGGSAAWPADVAVPQRPLPDHAAIAARHAAAPVPLIDTAGPFTVPASALTEWAAEAEEGERCVFARCEHLSAHKGLLGKVTQLAAAGVIVLQPNRRVAPDSALFDHVARRTYKPLAECDVPAPPPQPARDPQMEAIYARLKADAKAGRRASSDDQLALHAGLATRHQAAWRVQGLRKAGRIGIETVMGPQGAWRIVRVGKAVTASPPGWPV